VSRDWKPYRILHDIVNATWCDDLKARQEARLLALGIPNAESDVIGSAAAPRVVQLQLYIPQFFLPLSSLDCSSVYMFETI
jgi:hypothetical protein